MIFYIGVISMTTGEAIKAARVNAGMTQAMLAKKLHVTPQNISQYERNVKKPKYETLQKIADALGTTVFVLCGIDAFGEEVTNFSVTLADMYAMLEAMAEDSDTPETIREQIKKILPQPKKFAWQVTQFVFTAYRAFDSLPSFSADDINTILELLSRLNSKGKRRAIAQIQDLTEVPDYQKDEPDQK